MRALTAFLAVCFFALFAVLPARAADDENMIYESSTEYAEVDARVQKALASYPKLYEQLADEAKKFGVESHDETLAQWRKDKTLFRNPYSFSRVYRLRAAAGKYVSVIVDESEYTGGAHPNHGSKTLLWDRERGAFADFKTLFKDTADDSAAMKVLSKLVLDSLAAEKKARDVPFNVTDMWFKDWKAEYSMFGEPSLAPSTEKGKASGVTFHFSPYEVGAYAEGDYVAFVPATALMPLLTPEAQKLFGGERPKEDSDQN